METRLRFTRLLREKKKRRGHCLCAVFRARELLALNHAARDARAGVSRGLAFQIIHACVDDHRPTDNRVRSIEAQVFVHSLVMRRAARVGGDVSKVAFMPRWRVWRSVRRASGIEMTAGGSRVWRGTVAL